MGAIVRDTRFDVIVRNMKSQKILLEAIVRDTRFDIDFPKMCKYGNIYSRIYFDLEHFLGVGLARSIKMRKIWPSPRTSRGRESR